MNQSTWEPMKNLETAKELVEEYNQTHPLTNQPKTVKTKNKDSFRFIQKKTSRGKEEKVGKEENDEKNKEIIPNEKVPDDGGNNNGNEIIQNINENDYVKTFTIDDSLKTVHTVKQQNQKLMAVVEKMESNGEISKTFIPTDELRKTNPWILLDFYESKIKFT